MPHINKYIDFTVVVYVIFEQKVLLIYHKQLQKWLPLGGHIELNENPEEALFREVKEESGLEIEIIGTKPSHQFPGQTFLFAPAYLDIHDINAVHKHIGMVYMARAKSSDVRLADQEHEQIRWFTKEELDDTLYHILDGIKFYANEALNRVLLSKNF